MISGVSLKSYLPSLIFVVVAVLITTLIDLYVLDYGISYRDVIVMSGVLAGLLVFAAGNRGLKVGMVFLVATFALGYRTMKVVPTLTVHPSELVLWGVFVLPIVQPANWRQNKIKIWLPYWLVLFIPFWIFAWFRGLNAGLRWEEMFNEFRNFLLLIPLFIITEMVLANRTNWRPVLLTFYYVGTWIAGMGVIEYVFPGIKNIFSAFITTPEAHDSPEGFARAIFSFWGTPAATFILVLSAPMAVVLWGWWSKLWQRVLTLLALILQVCGIYIGGYRSMWMVFAVEFLVFAILRRKAVVAAGALLLSLLGAWLLPTQAQERALSGIYLVAGNPQHTDTSGIKRWGRMTTAFADALSQPIGQGWAASGWVHNDFVQVAANLGLLAGLLFIAAFLFTFCRLLQRVLINAAPDDLQLGLALLLAFIGAGVILAFEGVEVVTQLVLPVWFIWVLVEVWLRQRPKLRESFQ